MRISGAWRGRRHDAWKAAPDSATSRQVRPWRHVLRAESRRFDSGTAPSRAAERAALAHRHSEAVAPRRVGVVPGARPLNDGGIELSREVRSSALDERLPVIVLAGGVTALGVLRAFGRAGVPAFVHPDTDEAVRYSRWYRPLPDGAGGEAGAGTTESPSLALLTEALARSGLRRGFLCACTDDWNRAVAQYAETAAPRFVSAVPTRAVLDRLQDKGRLATLMQQLAVPMPMYPDGISRFDVDPSWPLASTTTGCAPLMPTP